MGILTNAISIVTGSLLGAIFKEKIKLKNINIFGISIMIISIAGFIENIFDVSGMTLKSNDLFVVLFALIIGTVLGDAVQFDIRVSNMSNLKNNRISEVIDAALFFGVGGMQICGPILLATVGDNSQLVLKSIIDFPFALMFGMSYGKRTSLSAIPVALMQIAIALLSVLAKDFLTTPIIKQLCATGYIILFFSGFNLLCEKKYKISNVNMIIGIFIIILYNAILKLWR